VFGRGRGSREELRCGVKRQKRRKESVCWKNIERDRQLTQGLIRLDE
jgi:hypothetical protein